MTTISLADLSRDPDSLIRRVAAGETLLVLDGDRPVAEIRPAAESPRPYGLCAGEFVVPDDFDAPLPTEVLNSFNQQ
jgi:antitoxin (DNA-binding transcriptional repressor) of toxin-antitoxin stability system